MSTGVWFERSREALWKPMSSKWSKYSFEICNGSFCHAGHQPPCRLTDLFLSLHLRLSPDSSLQKPANLRSIPSSHWLLFPQAVDGSPRTLPQCLSLEGSSVNLPQSTFTDTFVPPPSLSFRGKHLWALLSPHVVAASIPASGRGWERDVGSVISQ